MIRLDHAAVAFGGRTGFGPATVRLEPGTLVTVMGPNGSGKTTLLRLLAGLIEPSTGSIERGSLSVAYLSQHHGQHHWLPISVREVVTTGRFRRSGLVGRLRGEDRDAVDVALARLGIADLADRPIGELSGGQRQRVMMATAVVGEADILLLDEPITGLDPPTQHRILEVVLAERELGRLVVVTTHHVHEARSADRVLLVDTEIAFDGPPETALRPDALALAFGAELIEGDTGSIVLLDDHVHGTASGAHQ